MPHRSSQNRQEKGLSRRILKAKGLWNSFLYGVAGTSQFPLFFYSKPIAAFFSILIVLLPPAIFCKALAFPRKQLESRYSDATR
jgi:hypothetical protein